MSGHNKWTQIKRKKAVVDAARGNIFAKYSKAITNEIRVADGDIASPNVRATIERAQKENMPKDAIERAIQKGLGVGVGTLAPVLYEMFGPGGVALLIHGTTDNNNRTVNEIKHLVSEHGYTLGTQGSAQWAFLKSSEGYSPVNPVRVNNADHGGIAALVNDLLSHDDIDAVYSNELLT